VCFGGSGGNVLGASKEGDRGVVRLGFAQLLKRPEEGLVVWMRLRSLCRCLDSYKDVRMTTFYEPRTPRVNSQLSSPSKMPGMPTRSKGMPSSASASMFNGCSRARREAKPGAVYCPLARPVLGISSNLGGFGGGGSALEYRMRAMKSW
jgi:hypothetical protein